MSEYVLYTIIANPISLLHSFCELASRHKLSLPDLIRPWHLSALFQMTRESKTTWMIETFAFLASRPRSNPFSLSLIFRCKISITLCEWIPTTNGERRSIQVKSACILQRSQFCLRANFARKRSNDFPRRPSFLAKGLWLKILQVMTAPPSAFLSLSPVVSKGAPTLQREKEE